MKRSARTGMSLSPSLIAFLTLVGVTAAEQSAPPPSVDVALEQLAVALEREEGLAPSTKDALVDLVAALRAERGATDSAIHAPSKGEIAKVVDEYLTARPPVVEPSQWDKALERLHVSGDLRLRHETTGHVDDSSVRNRERLRFRLGFTYRVLPARVYDAI